MDERIVVGVVILCACLFLALKLRKTLRGEGCSGCGGACRCGQDDQCAGGCCHKECGCHKENENE